jgi:hypothetical protein
LLRFGLDHLITHQTTQKNKGHKIGQLLQPLTKIEFQGCKLSSTFPLLAVILIFCNALSWLKITSSSSFPFIYNISPFDSKERKRILKIKKIAEYRMIYILLIPCNNLNARGAAILYHMVVMEIHEPSIILHYFKNMQSVKWKKYSLLSKTAS